jgi:hypothetical protein
MILLSIFLRASDSSLGPHVPRYSDFVTEIAFSAVGEESARSGMALSLVEIGQSHQHAANATGTSSGLIGFPALEVASDENVAS